VLPVNRLVGERRQLLESKMYIGGGMLLLIILLLVFVL